MLVGVAEEEVVLVAVELLLAVPLRELVVEALADPWSRLKLVDVSEELDEVEEEPLETANVVSRRAMLPSTLVVVE